MAFETGGGRMRTTIGRVTRLIRRYEHINWALADQAVVSGASFLTTVLVARLFGKEDFGRFVLAWMGVFLVQALQVAVIAAPMMNIGSKQSVDQRPAYLGAVLVHQAVFGVATSVLVYLAAHMSALLVPEWHLDALALPLAVLVFIGQTQDFLRRYYYALHRPELSFAFDLLRYSAQMLVLAALLFGFRETASLSVVFYAMSGVALIAILAGVPFFGPVSFERQTMKTLTAKHWSFSRWLLGASLSEWVSENFVSVGVGAVLGLAEVGAWRAAQQLVLIVNIPLQGMGNLAPMQASLAYDKEGVQGLMSFMRGFVLRYMAAIGALLAVMALSGEFLLTSVYGEAYAGYGFLVTGFALVMMVLLMRFAASIAIRAMEITSFEFFAYLAGVAFILLATYPLISSFGLIGALGCEVLFNAIVLAVMAAGLRRRLPVSGLQ